MEIPGWHWNKLFSNDSMILHIDTATMLDREFDSKKSWVSAAKQHYAALGVIIKIFDRRMGRYGLGVIVVVHIRSSMA
jgi:hypothetical protein